MLTLSFVLRCLFLLLLVLPAALIRAAGKPVARFSAAALGTRRGPAIAGA